MGILVWGTGNYYAQKKGSIPEDEIIAYVSAGETGRIGEKDIICPKELFRYQYDGIYVLTGPDNLFEIMEELRLQGYKEWDKVIPGCNIPPYTEAEAILMENGEIRCSPEGRLMYHSPDFTEKIDSRTDLDRIIKRKIRCRKRNTIAFIPSAPISRVFGFDRGMPIDRYYIERFLAGNAHYIRGTVLEVAGREYTVKYGTDVRESISMHISDGGNGSNRVANLETGEGIEDNIADCFILTQTLPFVFHITAAAENTVRMLKSGGVALITVPGITQISRYDMDRWGHYWSFTTASLKKLFESCSDVAFVEVKAYGNVKTAASGLYGLAVEDMEQEDLAYQDDDYQQLITAVVRKK